MKRRKYRWIMLGGVLLILFLTAVTVLRHGNMETVTKYMEQAEKEQGFTDGQQEIIEDYLDSKKEKDSEYYFISAFMDFLQADYQTAEKKLQKASVNLEQCANEFVRSHTYLLLNEILENQNKTEGLCENAALALKYIGGAHDYRNNTDLCWRAVAPLRGSSQNILQGARLLEKYAAETDGLKKETVIKLYGNIGQLYSLTGSYSSALYYYWRGMDELNSGVFINDSCSYQAKFWAMIGDIAYVLEQYPLAIENYNRALEAADTCGNSRETAFLNSLSLINKSASYLELGEFSAAEEALKELDKFLPELDVHEKDDIEILRYNQEALILICTGKSEEAEEKLIKAETLIKTDTEEYSLNKNVYLEYTRACLYKSRKQYDKAIPLYLDIEAVSREQGLDFEKSVYYNMAEIYKEQKELDEYIRYHELYTNVLKTKNLSLSEEYIEYSQELYEYNLLKKKEYRRDFFFFIVTLAAASVFSFVIIALIKWRQKSWTDQLTGLHNRMYLQEYMKKNSKRMINRPLSVIMADIDFFKQYNDYYGHLQGDQGIKSVAGALKASARKDDLTVRYGGEELLVVLPGSSPDGTRQAAERIQKNIQKLCIPHFRSAVSDRLTVSMGIYTAQYRGEDISVFIEYADKALYQAKAEGRNCYRQYQEC